MAGMALAGAMSRARGLLIRRGYAAAAGFGRLDGRVAVVAGAGNPASEGHGIGAMTSLVLARQGARVVSVSNAAENAETITQAIRDEGLEGLAHGEAEVLGRIVDLARLGQRGEPFSEGVEDLAGEKPLARERRLERARAILQDFQGGADFLRRDLVARHARLKLGDDGLRVLFAQIHGERQN